MISHKLKLITGQILINILSRLFTREVRDGIPIKRFLTHCEEQGINIQPRLDTRATRFTLTKMIARREQLCAAHAILRVVINLYLTQVFHKFSI